jgi:hypothetical protein
VIAELVAPLLVSLAVLSYVLFVAPMFYECAAARMQLICR